MWAKAKWPDINRCDMIPYINPPPSWDRVGPHSPERSYSEALTIVLLTSFYSHVNTQLSSGIRVYRTIFYLWDSRLAAHTWADFDRCQGSSSVNFTSRQSPGLILWHSDSCIDLWTLTITFPDLVITSDYLPILAANGIWTRIAQYEIISTGQHHCKEHGLTSDVVHHRYGRSVGSDRWTHRFSPPWHQNQYGIFRCGYNEHIHAACF